MFKLENILSYASSNMQIIGIFIAIIGGLVITKLINLKVEKDALQDKLARINREIRFYKLKNIDNKNELFKINKADYIVYIYDKIGDENFNIDNYQDYSLNREQRESIIKELREMMENAKNIFKEEHTKDEVPKILKENGFVDGTIEYMIYEYIGNQTRKRIRGVFGQIDPSEFDYDLNTNTSFWDNMEERDLSKKIHERDEFLEWKKIEKEDIESKLKSISNNLSIRYDLYIFILITIFSILIPQIVLIIYPLFYKYKFLKYVFGIYSIFTFLVSMIIMLIYMVSIFISIRKNNV